MEDFPSVRDVSIMWRGKRFALQMSPSATLKELGHELQKLTNVKADTMRFIVPNLPNKAATLLTPFSEEHERLSLQETSITGGKPIRMMGVSENEVEEILQGEKLNLRIAGFDEEEKRLQQRTSRRPHSLPKLPQGPYIFCDFRTLRLPGIELNPPASEALKRMHMLASDPGIIAIMNKHRWRVGIMTEMAPIGYVGISPKCLLGFNKNQGEEISLRLRTDDLKGFRKYESIKKTLLHELAHMVHSEHDENFFALNSQLNKEAASLDWTRSTSHTLSGVGRSENYDEEFYVEDGSTISQKLGGNASDQFTSARVASVAAAYRRIADALTANSRTSEVHEEPDPDDSESLNELYQKQHQEPDPDEYFAYQNSFEPDPDDSQGEKTWASEPFLSGSRGVCEPSVTDLDTTQLAPTTYESDPSELDAILKHFVASESEPFSSEEGKTHSKNSINEPDPDDLEVVNEPDPNEVDANLKHFVEAESEPFPSVEAKTHSKNSINEPDPDDLEDKQNGMDNVLVPSPVEDNSLTSGTTNDQSHLIRGCDKADVRVSQDDGVMEAEPYPVHSLAQPVEDSRMQIDEPNPDDEELRRIQDPVTIAFGRFQKSIEMLRAEVDPAHAAVVLQTLYKIISNVIEHPDETKFRRLRKANPAIQKTVAKYNAAVELLVSIGFNDEPVSDETGKTEMYLVLKRNDPGLLWLAKSCIETNITR